MLVISIYIPGVQGAARCRSVRLPAHALAPLSWLWHRSCSP